MNDETKAKIDKLRADLAKVGDEHADKAASVAGFAAAAAHEASRAPRSPKLLRHAVEGLRASAEQLEATHPKLVAAVAEICRELSALGI